MLETPLKAIEPSSPSLKQKVQQQCLLVIIHGVNLVSNILGNDVLSCWLRRKLLRLLGAQLGPGTVIRGGGYFYGGKLTTGARCQINRGCYFDFTGSITFGNDVVVGHGVTFITAEHQIENAARRAGPVSGRPIVVQDGAWIGANSTVLPGVTIGRGAVVGAGSMVTKDISPNVVVVGVPAKVIRDLEDAAIAVQPDG